MQGKYIELCFENVDGMKIKNKLMLGGIMRFSFNQRKNLAYRVVGMILSIVIMVGCLIVFLAIVKFAWWYLTLN